MQEIENISQDLKVYVNGTLQLKDIPQTILDDLVNAIVVLMEDTSEQKNGF